MENNQENVIGQQQENQGSPTTNAKWVKSPKQEAILQEAARSSQNISDINSKESQDHHSHPDSSEGDQDSELDYSAVISNDANTSEDGSTEADDFSSDDPEVSEKNTTEKNRDIPQWGKDNPARWGQYIARQKEKEYEAKIAAISKENDDRLNQYENLLKANTQNNLSPQENENIFYDPKTGMQVDITTPEGEALAKEIILESKRNDFKQQISYQEYKTLQKKQEMILAEKIEEAKFKYKDYDDVVLKNGYKFSQPMVDMAAIITDNSTNDNLNGADFLYYLAKNPAELNKISSMNPYQQYSNLVKHAIKFSSKPAQVSKAPEPINTLSRGMPVNSSSGSSSSLAKDIMKNKYSRKNF
jgi:hypothetical protein